MTHIEQPDMNDPGAPGAPGSPAVYPLPAGVDHCAVIAKTKDGMSSHLAYNQPDENGFYEDRAMKGDEPIIPNGPRLIAYGIIPLLQTASVILLFFLDSHIRSIQPGSTLMDVYPFNSPRDRAGFFIIFGMGLLGAVVMLPGLIRELLIAAQALRRNIRR